MGLGVRMHCRQGHGLRAAGERAGGSGKTKACKTVAASGAEGSVTPRTGESPARISRCSVPFVAASRRSRIACVSGESVVRPNCVIFVAEWRRAQRRLSWIPRSSTSLCLRSHSPARPIRFSDTHLHRLTSTNALGCSMSASAALLRPAVQRQPPIAPHLDARRFGWPERRTRSFALVQRTAVTRGHIHTVSCRPTLALPFRPLLFKWVRVCRSGREVLDEARTVSPRAPDPV
jgi:hypothetical protein